MLQFPLTSTPATRAYLDRSSRRLAAVVAAAMVVISACGSESPTANRVAAHLTVYKVPTRAARPRAIVSGPGGDMWFAATTGHEIVSVTQSGVFTEYPIPQAPDGGITVGSDGALWITEGSANRIGRLSPDGHYSDYAIPTLQSDPQAIAAEPDGNIWFTENAVDKVGRIPKSRNITEFSLGGTEPTTYYLGEALLGVTGGPDGNVWVAIGSPSAIAKVSAGGAVSRYSGLRGDPFAITAGPDGNIWFAEGNGNPAIGRITPSGTIKEYPIPEDGIPTAYPLLITSAGGKLWFSMDSFGDFIGSVTTSGDFTLFELPGFPNDGDGSELAGLAVDPEGNIWYTPSNADEVVKVNVSNR